MFKIYKARLPRFSETLFGQPRLLAIFGPSEQLESAALNHSRVYHFVCSIACFPNNLARAQQWNRAVEESIKKAPHKLAAGKDTQHTSAPITPRDATCSAENQKAPYLPLPGASIQRFRVPCLQTASHEGLSRSLDVASSLVSRKDGKGFLSA